MQYPADKTYGASTQVIRFLDGSEQRFRDYPQILHRWLVQLHLLDETEMNTLREFFRIQNGAAGQFSFTDPWDGMQYANCSLETDDMEEIYLDAGSSQTALVIRENKN